MSQCARHRRWQSNQNGSQLRAPEVRMFEEKYSYSVIVAIRVGSASGQGAGRRIRSNLCKVKVSGD